MKCSKCGKEIANESLFCEYCGEQIEKSKPELIKRRDVIWVLLSMLFATYAMWQVWNMTVAPSKTDLRVAGLIPLFLALIPFFYTLYKAYKNEVAKSFVLVMFLLLIANGTMVYEIFNPVIKYEINKDMSWEGGEITLKGICYSVDKIDTEELEMFQAEKLILNSLNEFGFSDIHSDDYNISIKVWVPHYTVTMLILCFVLFCFFLYIIYAFIAHKKGWRF